MNAKDYRNLIIAALKFNIESSKEDNPYEVNKYNTEDYTEGLNEGFIAGLKRALYVVENSDFLVR